jgi:hypothetical protein
MRSIHLALACLLLCQCGRTGLDYIGDADTSPALPAGPLAEICVGDTPKAVMNGIASTPTVAGHVRFFDCCEDALFLSSVPSFDYKIYVEWSVSYGDVPVAHPITLDLAHPPKNWKVGAYLSCANGMGCDPPPDEYNASHDKNDGLAGVLTVQRASSDSSLYEMSLCLSLHEPAAHPHPLLQSLELYVPNIATN